MSARRTEITTFAPEPYRLLQPIPVVIRNNSEDGFVASFVRANVHASGDTRRKALDNLRSLVLDLFESLRDEKSALGPGPRRQWEVLRLYVGGTAKPKAGVGRRRGAEAVTARARLSRWQVSALLGIAADGECPLCLLLDGDVDLSLGPRRYDALRAALDCAGCNRARDQKRATPERVLRELERAGLA